MDIVDEFVSNGYCVACLNHSSDDTKFKPVIYDEEKRVTEIQKLISHLLQPDIFSAGQLQSFGSDWEHVEFSPNVIALGIGIGANTVAQAS